MRELEPGLWWWEAVHPEWTEKDAATEDWGPEVFASLQPLLDLPVAHVLPTHGPPTDRAALERALA